MQGKTVVVTGATSGIGEVAAVELARQGARIVFIARNPLRRDTTLARLSFANDKAEHTAYLADLSRLSEMRRVAGEIAAAEPKIDVLIDNAGALFAKRETTADGLEMTFATNHMAYFVITNLLLNNLKATPGARIVVTASDAHKSGKLDFGDLQAGKSYSAFRVYGTSKLCNILFTRELARRLAGTGVTANCLHPGFVATQFADNNDGLLPFVVGIAKRAAAITPEEGAKTIIHLASSPQVAGKSGGYFYKCAPATPTAAAQNDADAKRLWDVSAKIAGVGA
ncbi:MAG: SDR family oxidoreductase [Alphaproteobacteria bacterium]|nr:SDR family oxidoreductase [Alphaproteobacteria bacterium]MDE2630248.1 SDR family oxidoreductase [Alphaproteobacteria bacterium]